MNKKVLKDMFDSSKLPTVNFGLTDIVQEAQKLVGKLSISGVQPKLLVKLDKGRNTLVVADKDSEYILKPQQTFPNIPENEQCCMDIAQELGMDVPPHCLLPLNDQSLAYVIKRYDREKGEKLQQEDFMQLLGLEDKYHGSVEKIGKKLREVSSAPGYDVQLLFERVLLNFILGNGDAHLKNYSILYKKGNIRLAPAYDIVCSRLVIATEDEAAISIDGKKNELLKRNFDALAEYLRVPGKIRYEKFENKFELMKKIITNSQLKKEDQNKFLNIIQERLARLELPE